MGHWIECKKCGKSHRYDSAEIENIGTLWHPVLAVTCHNCGAQITSKQDLLDVFDVAQIRTTRNGVQVELVSSKKTGRERAESSDIREYWIQEYIKANHEKLGFTKIDGPYRKGPDFNGIYRGKEVVIEAERDCRSFIEHGHHEDERFEGVSVLVVLNSVQLSEEIRHRLPDTIIHIDVDDFVAWWRPRQRVCAQAERTWALIDLIAGEFQKRYAAQCSDRDRDMSTCPECDLCPYFGEGTTGEARAVFEKMAWMFTALYRHPIRSESLSLADIEASEIDRFYFDSLTETE